MSKSSEETERVPHLWETGAIDRPLSHFHNQTCMVIPFRIWEYRILRSRASCMMLTHGRSALAVHEWLLHCTSSDDQKLSSWREEDGDGMFYSLTLNTYQYAGWYLFNVPSLQRWEGSSSNFLKVIWAIRKDFLKREKIFFLAFPDRRCWESEGPIAGP